MDRTYSELIKFKTFEERVVYLKLESKIGEKTFGSNRYLNQRFYNSEEWKRIRRNIIIRDNGCNLGVHDEKIYGKIYIHHINPIGISDIINHTELLTNSENLICVDRETHDIIHYNSSKILNRNPIIRTMHDTCPWKQH